MHVSMPAEGVQNMYIKGINLLKRQMKAAVKAKDNAVPSRSGTACLF